MNINKIFSIGLAAIALAACTAEPLRNPDMDKQANLPGAPKDVEDGVVIVKFSAAALPSVEAAAEKFMATKSSEMPTSGIPSVDEIFERINVTGLVRVFPSDKAHEAATKAAGLDRWYEVHFDKSQDLAEASRLLSSVSEISKTQYSNKMYKADATNKIVPFTAQAARPFVKSEFNDPDLFWQWGLINNADQAIATKAVAGMDINVADAWKLTAGDPRVVVAVLDEGVKYTHPDLAANMWTNPKESENGNDDDGNGYVDDICCDD